MIPMKLRFLLTLAVAAVCAGAVPAQPTPKPLWAYAYDLGVRKGGEKDWPSAPTKIGVEFFKEPLTGATLAITQAGNITVIDAGEPAAKRVSTWSFGHDMRARKADEDKFSKDTTIYGVEAYLDTASNKLLYVDLAGSIAYGGIVPASKDKGPVWHHALLLKVRGPKEEGFGKDSKKFGVEVYKDENTGGLIYITENGSLAPGPAPAAPPEADKVKAPKALYGLICRVRKADEPDFVEGKTAKFGLEVFKDENTGGLIYISETGSIATSPAPADLKEKQGLEWKKAMSLKARPGGVPEFAKANKYGVEVFTDKNSGNTLFITETGSIAVLPAKK
jgi:hypothetical protein